MKTKRILGPIQFWRWILAALLLATAAAPATAQLQAPVITSIRPERTNVVVTTRVPPGIRRVSLECRERLGVSSWEPRAVTRLDGTGGVVTFRLPFSRHLEVMRVRGDAAEPLPAAFFTGTNAFLGEPGSAYGSGANGVPTALIDTTTRTDTTSREVVESDIWKTRGSTLYFFNQYRGLQVIDVTNPDAATVRGTLELPAAGEQMYLLGANHVVLLARDGCAYDESQVLIVADHNGAPVVVARLPVSGYIQESRLVGTALYVASQLYRPVANSTSTTWEWGTLVSSFDLADPTAPVTRNTLWYPGYGNVVSATDVCLFVVTQSPTNWWQSIVRVIDITSPDGTMNAYGSVTTAGQVKDKFKLNYAGIIFTTISEDWRATSGARVVTKLETFRVPDPRSMGPLGIVKLGELELGRGESLRATRFDGDRVYVVTFFQIDPLWVVDLSDPAAPRLAGSVEVPGWSTYIEPLGDRLVTMGVETGRVAVSLFDVANPASPALLNRVLLGQTWSWSEANYEEKAFTMLPDAGLILVPFNGDITNRYTSVLQLIDLGPNTLTARGQIQSSFQFRRATVYASRILSISGWELLSVDAGDRDHPVVSGRTELAWSVDRVFLAGDYLVELAAGSGWDESSAPLLRVALAATPDTVLSQLSLTNLPVLGAAAREGRLYIAQGVRDGYYPYPILLLDGTAASSDPNSPTFVLTVVSLSALPTLEVSGQTAVPTQSLGWGGDWQAVWPKPGVVVWTGGGQDFWWWWRYPGLVVMPANGGRLAMPDCIGCWPWYRGGGAGHLLAFDVSDPTAPQFASEVNLTTNNWWSFSPAFATEGLVYSSHRVSEFIVGLNSPWQTTGEPTITTNAATGETVTNAGPVGTWVTRSYLDVVDYADPQDPLVRRPVNVPGTLQGVSEQGALLHTVGTHWTTNTSYAWREYLDASAYDGVSAHLVDSLPLPDTWPHPVRVVGINILLGRPGTSTSNTNTSPPVLENWVLTAAGRFELLSSVNLASPASVLADIGGLLAVHETDNTVDLFVIGNATALTLVGRGQPAGCWWFDLNHADGEMSRGLWIPLGAYGVVTVPVKP